MEKFQANFPMALDEPNHRLFIGCRKPARLIVLDTETGKSVTDLAASGDMDDLFYDAIRTQLYSLAAMDSLMSSANAARTSMSCTSGFPHAQAHAQDSFPLT